MPINIMFSGQIIIRKCRDADYRFVHDISKRNMEPYVKKHWGGWSSKIFKKKFEKGNIRIVEYERNNRRRIGFYDVEAKKDYLYLHNLQLTTLYRGKGLGKYLMTLIEKGAKRSNFKKIKSRVFKDNPAKDFYSKIGYKVVKDDGNSVFIEKNLD